MLPEGYYRVTLASAVDEDELELRLVSGRISGQSTRGVDVNGSYVYDPRRNIIRFELTSEQPLSRAPPTATERVTVRGEFPAGRETRFSYERAGRAVDATIRFLFPLQHELVGAA